MNLDTDKTNFLEKSGVTDIYYELVASYRKQCIF